jgi:hypothetical protein
MKNSLKTALVALVGAVVAACGGKLLYGEADEPSIVFTQPIGTTIPGDPTQTPIVLPQGIVTFTFKVPNIPFSAGSTTTTQAGFDITSSMKLNVATLTMPPSTNADFNGLDTVTLAIETGSTSQTIASYTKDPSHLPGKTLVLQRSGDVEMLQYLVDSGSGSRTMTLTVSATGTLPANNWTADADMDLHIRATAGWP